MDGGNPYTIYDFYWSANVNIALSCHVGYLLRVI